MKNKKKIMKFKDKESVLNYVMNLDGKTISKITKSRTLNVKDRGFRSKIVCKEFLKLHHYSSMADILCENGDTVEVKLIPVSQNLKTGKMSSTGRLVFNLIDYDTVEAEEFLSTNTFYKIRHLILVPYIPKQNPFDDEFLTPRFVNIDADDIYWLNRDFKTVQAYVRNGKAHHLTEGTTRVLGCPMKKTGSISYVTQPNSDVPARQRAFAFKAGYVTALLNR